MREELAQSGRHRPADAAVRYADGKLTVDAAALSHGVAGVVNDSSAALRVAGGDAKRAVAEARARLGLGRPPARLRASTTPSLGPGVRSVVVVGTGAGGAPRAVVVEGVRSGAAPSAPLGGLLLLFLAAAALLAVVRSDHRGAAGGKWVRDRSLGGRLVRVEPAARSSANSSPAGRWRRSEEPAAPSPLDDDASPGASQTQQRRAAASAAPPGWWQEPTPVYGVSEARRAAAAADARAAVARLNAARVGGASYSPSDFLLLRASAAAASCTVDVAAGESARDALYRGAVDLALREAASPSGGLQGSLPSLLLSGLALDLALSPARAALLVAGCEAAALRGALLDSLAHLRREGAASLAAQERLLQLGAQLRALPLPADAAEVELVAAGLSARCTAAERRQLHALFCAGNGEGKEAATVAAALAPLD